MFSKEKGKTWNAALIGFLRSVKETPLFLVCFLGAAAAVIFFVHGYFFSSGSDEKPIGSVMSRSNVCQRLLEGRNLWNRLNPGTVVYNGDTIITGNFSQTEIVLDDGTMLRIKEESCLEVRNANDKEFIVTLSQGSSVAETGNTGLSIQAGNIEFKLYPHTIAEFRLASDGGRAYCSFLGDGLTCSHDGKNLVVGERRAFSIDTEGNVFEGPMMDMFTPFNRDYSVYPAAAGTQSFKIARGNITETKSSSKDIVRPYPENDNFTEPWEIFPREIFPREIFPPDNYITSSAFSPDLFFTWMNPSPFPAVFQISSRSDFSGEMLVEETLRTQGCHGWFLVPGTYYWRIMLEYPQKTASTPRRLVVLPAFNAPGIISPQEGENIRLTDGTPLEFRWEKQNYADSYEFMVFAEGRGTPIYEISSLKDTMVQVYFDPRAAGRFRWTVNAYTESGNEATRNVSLFKSNSFSIGPPGAQAFAGIVRIVARTGEVHTAIALRSPRTGSSLVYDEDAPAGISWSLDEPLWNSRVLFSRNPEPSTDPKAVICYVDQGVTSITLPFLSEGVWFWIVEGDTRDGKGISAAAPFWFTILPQSPLPSPRYLFPEDGSVFSLEKLTLDRHIAFQWEEVPGASAYIFSLFGNDDKHELLFSSTPIPAISFILDNLEILTVDDYNWQVEAVSMNRTGTIERRGIIQQYSFVVDISSSEYLRTRSQGIRYDN